MSRGWGVRSSPADLVSWGALLALQHRARRSAADNHSDTSGGCKSVPRPQLFFRSVHLGRIPILLFGGKKAIISPKSVEMQTCKALCSMKKTQAGMPVKLLELQVCSKWYYLYKAPLPPQLHWKGRILIFYYGVLLLLVVFWIQPTYFMSPVNFSLPFLRISINLPNRASFSVCLSESRRSPLVVVHQRTSLG